MIDPLNIIFTENEKDIYLQLETLKEDFNTYKAIFPDLIEKAKSHYRDKDWSKVGIIDKMLSVIHDPSLTVGYDKSEEYEDALCSVIKQHGSVSNILIADLHSKRNDPVVHLSCEELLYAYRTLNGLLLDYISDLPDFLKKIEEFENRICA